MYPGPNIGNIAGYYQMCEDNNGILLIFSLFKTFLASREAVNQTGCITEFSKHRTD